MTGHITDGWNIATVKSIFKTCQRHNCCNYRGISLLNSHYKIYAKIVAQWEETITETPYHKNRMDSGENDQY